MYSKHRLWLTINSMENIPSIDNRSLYADTLNSLYNNVYNLKNIRIQELNNVYDRDYNQLKNLLYNKYLKIIRDSEAGLADLIMNDLNNSYQNQVVNTFNIHTMYGGGNGPSHPPIRSGDGPKRPPRIAPLPPIGAPKTVPLSVIQPSKGATSKSGEIGRSLRPSGPPPPPRPPLPPDSFKGLAVIKDIKTLTRELDAQDVKLNDSTRRERREELLKIFVRETLFNIDKTAFNETQKGAIVGIKTIANEIVAIAKAKAEKNAIQMRSVSTVSKQTAGVPSTVEIPLYNLDSFASIKNRLKNLVLEVSNEDQKALQINITNMIEETDPTKNVITIEDKESKFEYIHPKEGVDKIIRIISIPENKTRPEFPQWRRNYLLMDKLTKVLLPTDDTTADSISGGDLAHYVKNVRILNNYFQIWTK